MWGENPHRRMPKASAARTLRSGLVGPKPRRKRVGDGQLVDIPAPVIGDEPGRSGGGWRAGRRGPFKLVGRQPEKRARVGGCGLTASRQHLSRHETLRGEPTTARTANRHWWAG